MISTPPPGGNSLPPALPFGKHKGIPLAGVPASYLVWVCSQVKLSSGLAAAVRAELARRGVTAPPAPEPKPHRCSRDSAHVGLSATWLYQRDGRKAVRGECAVCGASVGILPMTPENAALADAGTDPAALLKFLAGCEDAGVEVRKVRGDLQVAPWSKITPALRRLVRQVRGLLISLLKDETPRTQEAPR